MKIVIGIPARLGSTRFPGKPLVPLLGKPSTLNAAARTGCDALILQLLLLGDPIEFFQLETDTQNVG